MRRLRWIIWPLVVVLLLAGGAAYLILSSGREGEAALERWIGRHLIELVDAHLHPELHFDKIDYQYPLTVVIDNIRLSSPDPRSAATRVDVISARQATLTLTRLPQAGKPIQIEKLTFTEPTLRLVKGDERGFVGLTDMVRKREDRKRRETEQPAVRLSEVLRMREIVMTDGFIEYDPRVEGSAPMRLDRLSARLQIDPGGDGAYTLRTRVARDPLAEARVRGTINLDDLEVSEVEVDVKAEVTPDKLDFLPAQVRGIFKRYEVQGTLFAHISGDVPLADLDRLRGRITLLLTDGRVTLGDYQIPVQRLSTDLTLADSTATIETFSVEALRGVVNATGQVRLAHDMDARLSVDFSDIRLHDFLRTAAGPSTEASPPAESALAGRLAGRIDVEAPLRVVTAKLRRGEPEDRPGNPATRPWPTRWGAGQFEITNARLMRIPVISKIYNGILRQARKVSGRRGGRTETLNAVFEFQGDRIAFSELLYVGDVMAIRGHGFIGWDQRLDFRLNGGPIERLQELLGGRVGGLWGRVSDSIATYRVTGKVGEPQVRMVLIPGLFGSNPK